MNLSSNIKVEYLDSPSLFLSKTIEYRNNNEFTTNLISSISMTYIKNIFDEKCYWYIIYENEKIIGIAMKTGIRPLMLSPLNNNSLELLAKKVVEYDENITQMNGYGDNLIQFINYYIQFNNKYIEKEKYKIKLIHQLNLYELKNLIKPKNLNGIYKKITIDNLNITYNMMISFFNDCHLDINFDMMKFVESKINDGLLYYCYDNNDNNNIIGLCGHSLFVETENNYKIGRIGPMYVKPEYRNKGYASSMTYFLCNHLIDNNCKVILYAEVDNLCSNKVYQKLGFELINKSNEYSLTFET